MKIALLAAAAFLSLVACSGNTVTATGDGGSDAGPPPIHVTDYDTSCAAPSDCTAVDEGDVCGCGSCGNAAINKRDYAKWQADVAAKQKACAGGGPLECPALCMLTEVTCNAGKCGVCHSSGCSDAGIWDASSGDAL